MIKIGIVDDNRLIRNNLVDGLGNIEFLKVNLIAKNGLDFLQQMKHQHENELPEIVLMDLDMPELDGIATIKTAKVLYPNIEFLVLTVFDEDEKIFEAIKAGATGYILKEESLLSIAEFIKQVKEFRAAPMSPAIARKTLRFLAETTQILEKETVAATNLSPRELEVLKLMVEGYNYRKIADKLGLSHYTVRNQITSIYNKLQVRCKVDAVKLALKNKLI